MGLAYAAFGVGMYAAFVGVAVLGYYALKPNRDGAESKKPDKTAETTSKAKETKKPDKADETPSETKAPDAGASSSTPTDASQANQATQANLELQVDNSVAITGNREAVGEATTSGMEIVDVDVLSTELLRALDPAGVTAEAALQALSAEMGWLGRSIALVVMFFYRFRATYSGDLSLYTRLPTLYRFPGNRVRVAFSLRDLRPLRETGPAPVADLPGSVAEARAPDVATGGESAGSSSAEEQRQHAPEEQELEQEQEQHAQPKDEQQQQQEPELEQEQQQRQQPELEQRPERETPRRSTSLRGEQLLKDAILQQRKALQASPTRATPK